MKKNLLLNLLLLGCLKGYSQQPAPPLRDFQTFNAGMSFSCVTVDANNNVWAGTNKQGLFLLDQLNTPAATSFTLTGSSANLVIQSVAADRLGNLWVAHAGTNGSGGGGGVEQVNINSAATTKHYTADRNYSCILSFQSFDGLATRNVKSIIVDKNNTVWSAHRYHDLNDGTNYIVQPGAMSYKSSTDSKFITKGGHDTRGQFPEWPYPAYTCNPKPNETPQSRTCNAIASDSSEVWISVFPYRFDVGIIGGLPARIMTYSLAGEFKGVINFETIGIPAGGVFNGIYLSPKGHAWVSVSAGKGFAVRNNNMWTYFNPGSLPCIFPPGTVINDNAIWGNKYGNVFIGTNKGLIVYNGRGPVNVSSSYTLYSTATNTMTSNNILGGYSERDSIQWIATNNGIMKAIIGRYSTDDTPGHDYTSCNNADINAIEAVLRQPAIKRNVSYHIYKVETEICNQNDPVHGGKCSAENIYKLMVDNVALTTPTPHDFPTDNITPTFLLLIDQTDLNKINGMVNAWQPNPTPEDESGGIQNMMSVTNGISAQSKIETLSYFDQLVDKLQLQPLLEKQNHDNGNPKLVPCKEYHLYNSANFIRKRMLYDYTLEQFCVDNELESAQYDAVFVYPSDKDYTITNYTKSGHFLYPGKITRQVIEECGKVKVITMGEGVQYCGNNTLGLINARGNVVVGSILFKNIDLRLKNAFEKLP